MEINKNFNFISDSSIPTTWGIDEDTGFLTAPVVLSRTGIQTYYGYELGLDDRKLEQINVYRSEDEVFKPSSMDQYVNLTITNDHPNEAITVDNVKNLQVGSVSNVERDGNFLKGIATITDKNEIKKIMSGKKEVSVGYSQDLKVIDKTIDGVKCEFGQTNIKPNHLAVVDRGRCGAECRILNDKNIEDNLSVIKIAGVKHTIEDGKLKDAIVKLQKDAGENELALMEKLEEVKTLIEKMNGMKVEKEDVEKKLDEAEAEKNAMEKKEPMGDTALQKLISDKANEKAKLLTQAKMILGDKMPVCIDCDLKIMKSVIGDSFSEDDIMGRSPEYTTAYITALYDAAVKKFENGQKTVTDLSVDLMNDAAIKTITRDSVRNEYLKTLGKGVTV